MVGDIQVVQSVGNLAVGNLAVDNLAVGNLPVDTTCQLLMLSSRPTSVPRKTWEENNLCYTQSSHTHTIFIMN
jgi:hypothetical protein